MSITGAIVLYSVIWFITLWVLLPLGLRTQGDENHVVKGTHASAPANLRFGRKLLMTTLIATLIWCLIVGIAYITGFSIYSINPWRALGMA